MPDDREVQKYERFFRDPRVGDDVLRPPASGVACANIRTALRMLGYDNEYGDAYDEEIASSVLRFQTDRGHTSRDGHFGPGTGRLLARQLLEQFGTTIFGRLTDPQPGYIFVSYKREDISRIASFLDQIRDWGYATWLDKGIPGGAEWDALIEEKVSGCELLLVFLSQDAVDSKYVRREVKFADAQNKPILASRLEEVELRHGLNMLLSQYQMIDATNDTFTSELREALDHSARRSIV